MPLTSELISVSIQSHRAAAINGSVATGIAAAGTSSQANSTAITAVNNIVSTVSANNGVRLPQASLGDSIFLRNSSATTCLVYPPVGGAMNGGSANAADSTNFTTGARLRYVCTSADGLNWALC